MYIIINMYVNKCGQQNRTKFYMYFFDHATRVEKIKKINVSLSLIVFHSLHYHHTIICINLFIYLHSYNLQLWYIIQCCSFFIPQQVSVCKLGALSPSQQNFQKYQRMTMKNDKHRTQ